MVGRVGPNPPGPVGGVGSGPNPPGPVGGVGRGPNPPGPVGGVGRGPNPPGPAGGVGRRNGVGLTAVIICVNVIGSAVVTHCRTRWLCLTHRRCSFLLASSALLLC